MSDSEKDGKKATAAKQPVSLRSSTLQSLVRRGTTGPGTNVTASRQPAAGLSLVRPRVFSSVEKAKVLLPSKTSLSFTPNVHRETRLPRLETRAPSAEGGGVSVQNLLAHRLAVRGGATTSSALGAKRSVFEMKLVTPTLKSKMTQFQMFRQKRRKGKKSREISELSWPSEENFSQEVNRYTPISLPYVVRSGGEESNQGTESIRRSQRPSLKKVDEDNRNASVLFQDASWQDEDDESAAWQWTLVQWPSILPALDTCAMDLQQETLASELSSSRTVVAAGPVGKLGGCSKYLPSTFSELPEGRLGRMLVRQSGRVQLVVGPHCFEVNSGSDCNFAQEVGCCLPQNSEFFFLGKCLKRMTITPDVPAILRRVRQTNQKTT